MGVMHQPQETSPMVPTTKIQQEFGERSEDVAGDASTSSHLATLGEEHIDTASLLAPQLQDMIWQMFSVWKAVVMCTNSWPQPSMASSPQWGFALGALPDVSYGGSTGNAMCVSQATETSNTGQDISPRSVSDLEPQAALSKGHAALKSLFRADVLKITGQGTGKSQQQVSRKSGNTTFVVTFAGAPPQQPKGSDSGSMDRSTSGQPFTSFQ